MKHLVLDAELRAKLGGGDTAVEFTDEQGKPVGHFLTHEEFVRMQYEYARTAFSDADIREAREEMLARGGVSTADIRAAVAAAKREWDARS